MEDNILGCFMSTCHDYDETEEENLRKDKIGEAFRLLIWGEDGKGGVSQKLKTIPYEPYGNDLILILLQFNVLPNDYLRSALKEIEPYRKKEKSIGINIIIEEEFFVLSKNDQLSYIKDVILYKLTLLKDVVKRRKLDTKVDLLINTVTKVLVW